MKTFRVIILPRAEEDVERNARWWAEHHNAVEAANWFFTVRQQILALNQLPESHGLSAENDDLSLRSYDN